MRFNGLQFVRSQRSPIAFQAADSSTDFRAANVRDATAPLLNEVRGCQLADRPVIDSHKTSVETL